MLADIDRMQVAGLDANKVEYAMRTFDGKVWIGKIRITAVGVKEVLLVSQDEGWSVKEVLLEGVLLFFLVLFVLFFGVVLFLVAKEGKITSFKPFFSEDNKNLYMGRDHKPQKPPWEPFLSPF